MQSQAAMDDHEQRRRHARRVRRSAILWTLVALGFYLAFFWSMSHRVAQG